MLSLPTLLAQIGLSFGEPVLLRWVIGLIVVVTQTVLLILIILAILRIIRTAGATRKGDQNDRPEKKDNTP